MAEEEQATKVEAKPEAKPEKVSPAKRKSAVINKVLGAEIDWSKLSDRDLESFYGVITNNRKLRRLAIRILSVKIRGVGKGLKQDIKDSCIDVLSETGLGDRLLKVLSGDEDEDGLDGGE